MCTNNMVTWLRVAGVDRESEILIDRAVNGEWSRDDMGDEEKSRADKVWEKMSE